MLTLSLSEKIKTKIREVGFIDTYQFLKIVLFGEGGYNQTKHFLGKDGDFVTAPHISSLFSEMIALTFVDFWMQNIARQTETQSFPIFIIEFGGGDGRLMNDMIKVFQRWPQFWSKVSIVLDEINPHMRDLQKETFQSSKLDEDLVNKISFKSLLSDHCFQEKFCFLFTVGNEFLDVFPIKQYIKETSCETRKIILNQDKFMFEDSFVENKEVQIIEESPDAVSLLKLLKSMYINNLGMSLFFDYGDYEPNRSKDTLQAIYKHKYVSIFENLGECDITHLVDFYKLEQFLKNQEACADSQKCVASQKLEFFVQTQRNFLLKCGIYQRLAQLNFFKKNEFLTIQRSVSRLMDPVYMGTLFKVLTLKFWFNEQRII